MYMILKNRIMVGSRYQIRSRCIFILNKNSQNRIMTMIIQSNYDDNTLLIKSLLWP